MKKLMLGNQTLKPTNGLKKKKEKKMNKIPHGSFKSCFSSQSQLLYFSPEEGVMLHTDLPQPFGSTMIWKLETDCAFKLLKLQQGQNTVVRNTCLLI